MRAYERLKRHYRALLTRGARELPPIPVRSNGQRGRIAKSDIVGRGQPPFCGGVAYAHNLRERLKEHEGAVLLFARDANESLTNNRAERSVRMSKVKQKVSGCFRKAGYAQACCRISSDL